MMMQSSVSGSVETGHAATVLSKFAWPALINIDGKRHDCQGWFCGQLLQSLPVFYGGLNVLGQQFSQSLSHRCRFRSSCLPQQHFERALRPGKCFQFQFAVGIIDKGAGMLDGIGQCAQLVNQSQFQCASSGVNATACQSFQLVVVHVAAGCGFLSELFVNGIQHTLHGFAFRI